MIINKIVWMFLLEKYWEKMLEDLKHDVNQIKSAKDLNAFFGMIIKMLNDNGILKVYLEILNEDLKDIDKDIEKMIKNKAGSVVPAKNKTADKKYKH